MTPAKKVPPPDQAARDRICRDLGTTFLVEAGAGSGKTKSLVDRMIALLAGGRATIDTLAAVTFTRKAAAELRGRFQVALERRRATEKDSRVQARLDAALTGLEKAFIGTIHSFCARLLRERPVEAGIDPEFRELEEHEDRILLEKSWDEYQAKARLENEAGLRGLEEAGLTPAELQDAFRMMAEFPEVEAVPGRPRPPDLAAVRKALDALVDFAQTLVPREKPEKGRDGLQKLFVRLFRRRRNIGFGDDRSLMESVELCEKKLEVRKDRWARSKNEDALLARKDADRSRSDYKDAKAKAAEAAETMLAAAQTFQEVVAGPALREWREFRHSRALAFVEPAIGFYAKRRRDEGRLNFQDQLMLTAALLRGYPEVRRYFRKRFHPILVDEFQDTDPIQAEILFLLTGIPDTETDWTRLLPAPGSLFLVGDPKQSIYRFRRADIDIYNLVKARVVASGGETLALSANFRSLRPVADWINPLFDPACGGAFPALPDAYQAGFMPLETVRRGARGTLTGVRKITIPAVPYHRKEEITEIDSERLARFVAWSLAGNLRIDDGNGSDRPAEPGDFLVLFRYKDRMGKYARKLEERGILFEISGSDAFAGNAEIAEVMNLIRALEDPDDHVATVAALRGMFFGLSDQDLLDHRASGGGFCFLEEDGGRAGTDRVRRAFAQLRGWRDLTLRVPPSVALETIIQGSGLLGYLVTAEMGSSRAGNVLKLLEVLRGRETEDMISFAAAVAFMDEWLGAESVEETSLSPGRRNAVRLMNLHRAKGLEGAVVWLANPVGVRDFEPDRHIRRTGKRPLGHFRFSKPFGWTSRTVSQPVGWEESAAEEKTYEAAEEDRLMYVAATRARDLLVVSDYAADLGAKSAWGRLVEGLAAVDELPECPEVPGRAPSRAPRPRGQKPAVSMAEASRARQDLRRKMAGASMASWLHETVTSLARRAGEGPAWAKGGLGLWGSEVHIMLKSLGESWPHRGGAPPAAGGADAGLLRMARDVLVACGRDPVAFDELAAHVGAIIRSPFWMRAMRATRRLYEVPFSARVGPGDGEYGDLCAAVGPVPAAGGKPVVPAPGAPILLSGALDLVFEEEGGWVIADYKTDRLPRALEAAGTEDRDKALAMLVDHYRPQVELYTRFWAKISGERVKESGLYFTALDRWVRIETISG
jgi:ATP-dependent helicase/nuclease subunit A